MRYSFRSKSLGMLKLMPQLFHAGFISPKTKEEMLKRLESFISDRAPKLEDPEGPESPAKAQQSLSQTEIAFIKQHCIDAI